MYLYRYINVKIALKRHPCVEVPPGWSVWVRRALDRSFERTRMKEEWEEIQKANHTVDQRRELIPMFAAMTGGRVQ